MRKDNEQGMFTLDSLRQSRIVSKDRMLFWYAGILGNISLQTKSKVVDDALNVHIVHKRSSSEEFIVVFRPSFMINKYELRVVYRRGQISTTLYTDCVVDFKAQVFDMCRAGDIGGLLAAFESGSVSLDVVDPYGMGLLHVSTITRHLCSSSNT